jgi:hypothetical protein
VADQIAHLRRDMQEYAANYGAEVERLRRDLTEVRRNIDDAARTLSRLQGVVETNVSIGQGNTQALARIGGMVEALITLTRQPEGEVRTTGFLGSDVT